MLPPGECTYEASEGDLEQPMGLPRRNIISGRLLADHQLELGHEFDQRAPVHNERLAQLAAPAIQLRVAPASYKAQNEGSKGLRDGSVGNIPLMRIELACSEQTARRHEGLVQFMDHRG